ncbi:MAG: DUF3943 domain-containing protein [Candidatus Pedobacter colombiensis]|uniref:DUF3943 domain-containing protein n=1 Tax=Candidatus Pedobacter colombiensis TaxID=3121371 RepID=A0AAJ5W6Y4_9SPHI|nr:DUF3943 domain-containing protein [Pedobacter sp.]WEK18250.1 MAG: DUF3943 domain-containing protein [Pedobacter sp.]
MIVNLDFRTILLSLVLCISTPIYAQISFYNQHYHRDTVTRAPITENPVKKRFGRAAILFSLTEVIPWSFDRYVVNADFARINIKGISENLKLSSWAWDNDSFTTNQLAHPSHGSIFFNSFRSNGYSFWQSIPATIAGSYIWETAGENQAPSKNDFLNTSFGGVIIGEIVHRLSGKLINNRRRGFRRHVNETMALLINPANGFNRILDGKWGKIPNPMDVDSSKIDLEIDAGLRKFNLNDHKSNFRGYARVKLLYGSPFENYKIPFSTITVNVEVGKDDSTFVNAINVFGSIKGWPVSKTENSRHIAVLTANYDYILNQAFSYSGQSFKANLFSEFGLKSKTKINTSIGIGPVLLAAIPEKYLFDGRSYDFCSGVGLNANAEINIKNIFFYGLTYNNGLFHTWNGYTSSFFLQSLSSELRFKFIDDLSFCTEPGYFILKENYKSNERVTRTYPYLKVALKYNISIQ